MSHLPHSTEKRNISSRSLGRKLRFRSVVDIAGSRNRVLMAMVIHTGRV